MALNRWGNDGKMLGNHYQWDYFMGISMVFMGISIINGIILW
jgi:hypothetical protein